jgi:hypothetical protein
VRSACGEHSKNYFTSYYRAGETMQHKDRVPKSILILIIATSGCENSATKIAREAADRQAQQNTEMARLNKEVSNGA